MAYSVVPLVAVGDLWTAANQNTYLKDNMAAVWVGTTAGDVDYYTGAANKARVAASNGGIFISGAAAPSWLPIGAGGGLLTENGTIPSWLALGTAGQGLRTNNAATAPEWADVILDWEVLTPGDWSSTNVVAFQTVTNSTITLTLPVPGVIFCIGTCNLSTNDGTEEAALRASIGGVGSGGVLTDNTVIDRQCASVFHMKAAAAGNTDCLLQSYSGGAGAKSTVRQIHFAAFALQQ